MKYFFQDPFFAYEFPSFFHNQSREDFQLEKILDLQYFLKLYTQDKRKFKEMILLLDLEVPNSRITCSKNTQSQSDYINNEISDDYRIIKVKADGNCLYRAISLTIFGTEEKHEFLRLVLLKELIKNRKFYKKICQKLAISYQKVLESTLVLGKWATDVHIYILSNSLGRVINLYDGENKLQSYHQLSFVPKKICAKTIAIHWSNDNHNHFNSLLPIYQEIEEDLSIPVYEEKLIGILE